MLQSMGVLVLEERPFAVTRPDGMAVSIYQFKIRLDASMPVPPPTRSGGSRVSGSVMR